MNDQASREHVKAVDGLRAVAVLAIVIFHLDPAWLPGGFVGVDVFFVISGFVVAYSVARQPQSGIADYFFSFYRRRLLRIYPVLLLFISVTVIAATLFIPRAEPSKFIELTGASAVIAISNVFLWMKSGDYFATASEYNVFTHTWSLGVEEQYYVIFPFFSFFVLVRPDTVWRRRIIGTVALAALASLAACAILSFRNPAIAFYFLPTRFWELATGFLLFVFTFKPGRVLNELPASFGDHTLNAIGWLSSIGLIASICFADPGAFPFPWALLPTIATALLIFAAVYAPGHPVMRLLSTKALTWVGKISFSLYLWHWAVIVLMKWTVGLDSLAFKLVAASITTILSVLSFYLVEDAARTARWPKKLSMLTFYSGFIVASLVVAAMGVIGYVEKPALTLSSTGNLAVWDPYGAFASQKCARQRTFAKFSSGQVYSYAPCHGNGRTVFVMGDSHAGAYNRLFSWLASDQDYNVVMYTLGGCKLIGVFDEEPVPGCDAFRAATLKAIASAAKQSDAIFFPGHYTRRYRDAWHNEPLPTENVSVKTFARPDVDAIEVNLAPIKATGARIILEGPKPISKTALFRCADWFTKANDYCDIEGSAPRADLLQRSGELTQFELLLSGEMGLRIWHSFDVLCPPSKTICDVYDQGKPLFFDTDHLSGYGNDVLAASFLAELSD